MPFFYEPHVQFGNDFGLDAFPDATLSIYLSLGPAVGVHRLVAPSWLGSSYTVFKRWM